MNTTVDFVIAGSAKSGTTALNMMLDQHPDIYTSEIKETNYFIQGFEDTRFYKSLNGKRVLEEQDESDIIDSAKKYSSLFSAATKHQILGEASPWYLLNPLVPQRMLAHNKEVKVIILLRNPTDVAFANFVHQVRDRAECLSIDQMSEFFNTQRYADETLHPFSNHLTLAKYSSHLPAYVNNIPAKNLHIIIYEEFRQDREAVVSKVFDFLGLDSTVDIDVHKTVNISGLPKSDKLQDLIQGSMLFKKILGLVLPKKPRRRLRAYIEAKNTGKKAVLSERDRTKLDTLYSDDVRFVEGLLNRKIEVWHQKRLVNI